jgi:hypothetical protein
MRYRKCMLVAITSALLLSLFHQFLGLHLLFEFADVLVTHSNSEMRKAHGVNGLTFPDLRRIASFARASLASC